MTQKSYEWIPVSVSHNKHRVHIRLLEKIYYVSLTLVLIINCGWRLSQLKISLVWTFSYQWMKHSWCVCFRSYELLFPPFSMKMFFFTNNILYKEIKFNKYKNNMKQTYHRHALLVQYKYPRNITSTLQGLILLS